MTVRPEWSHWDYYVKTPEGLALHGRAHASSAAPPLTTNASPPVAYAIDPKRDLSPTPLTPIGDVDGTGDRFTVLSLA